MAGLAPALAVPGTGPGFGRFPVGSRRPQQRDDLYAPLAAAGPGQGASRNGRCRIVRVLMISHLYPSRADEVYGSFVHSQVRALQDLGCSVQVVAPTPWVPLPLAWVKGQWRRWRAAPKSDRLDGVDVLYPRILRTP